MKTTATMLNGVSRESRVQRGIMRNAMRSIFGNNFRAAAFVPVISHKGVVPREYRPSAIAASFRADTGLPLLKFARSYPFRRFPRTWWTVYNEPRHEARDRLALLVNRLNNLFRERVI